MKCSICGKESAELCRQDVCRPCHISIAFEDCVNGTTPEELDWKARKEAAERDRR